MLISDHSSNGTWIVSKSSGETIKLEKGNPTLLKEDDVILLTRSTTWNPEVISYKYHSSPFPRITKLTYKPGQSLDQSSAEMLECSPGIVKEDHGQQQKTSICTERKRKAHVQSVSARKVRFKLQSDDITDDQEPLMECPVENTKQRDDVCTSDASFIVTGKGRSTVKELDNTILDIDQTSDSDEEQRVTHTTTSSSQIPISSSTASLPGLHVLKSNVVRDSLQPPEIDETKDSEHKRTSGVHAPGDGSDFDKCTQCGKWIPHVTLSLHEAVCEGQSQEIKSQDHISLSSLPLENSLLREDSNAEMQNSAVKLVKDDADENDISVCSVTSESERTVKITRVDDESCEKKIVGTTTMLPSTSCDLSGKCTESNIIDKSSVTSCDSGKRKNAHMEENSMAKISCPTLEAQKLTSDSLGEVATPISPVGSEPALERTESNERCTFCSTLLPVSKLIEHASECSKLKVSAVPCAASDDTENMQEACPYCGEYFDVLELVEHVTHCKDLSRLVAEEVSLQDDSYPSSSPEVAGFDRVEDPSRSDKELCPKCRREFPLLELVSHASECKGERHSSGSESLRGDADGEGVERFDDTESKEGNGNNALGSSDIHDRNCDGREINDHDCSNDEEFSDKNVDITKNEHDSSSTCDNVEVVKSGNPENGEGKVSAEEDNADDDFSKKDAYDDNVTCGSSYYDDEHERDESENSHTINRESKIRKGDKDELGLHRNSCIENDISDGECVDAVVDLEVDIGSDEFEFCPNCRKLFHLSRLVEHASACVTGVKSITATSCEESTTIYPLTETSIVFCDCHYCGIRLPVDFMSSHYPKCEKQHVEKSSSEGSSRLKESAVPAGDLLACAKSIDNMSSRITLGTADPKRQASSTETNDFEESSVALMNKVARVGSGDRETDKSKEVLKRTTSSLDSYHDCEEQCVYCLKMFAVSVLVEHARVCAGLQQVKY